MLVWVGNVYGEVYSWTDHEGVVHFSDTPPADHPSKRLNMWSGCPLRGQIVDLQLEERANLGLWLFLGAPKITEDSTTDRHRNRRSWSMEPWQYEQQSRDHQLREIKNDIIFEARKCALGGEKACTCSLSLFHDPPRGFAPQGYIPPSPQEIKARSRQLAGREAVRP
jgi:hypothetical protein